MLGAMARVGRPAAPWAPFSQQSDQQKSITRRQIRETIQHLVTQRCGGEVNEVRAILDELYPPQATPTHETQLKELMTILQVNCNRDATYNQCRWASIPAQVFKFTRQDVRRRFQWNIGKSRMFNTFCRV
jgi:hypothetical protein